MRIYQENKIKIVVTDLVWLSGLKNAFMSDSEINVDRGINTYQITSIKTQ
jgi:hypothetical protein